MTFAWNPHRFSGGALALDVANSVILRFDAERCIDRFGDAAQLDAFAAAASAMSADRAAMPPLSAMDAAHRQPFLRLREAIDAHFRHATLAGVADNVLLAALLDQLAQTFARHGKNSEHCPVDLATAQSALGLIAAAPTDRMKICPNCEWLFLDRSKNRSRTWCDMTVCGNRAKARLHYHRKRKETAS